ncbi:hypothetical protein [Deinococcus sp. UYEF24]
MNKDQDKPTPEVMNLAQLLTRSPRAQAVLQQSIERQSQKAEIRQRVVHANCPYCKSEGVVYLTLSTGEFRRRRADCCQLALRDAAEAALHAGMNPNSNEETSAEELTRYMTLKSAIHTPALIRELETHEFQLRTINQRIFPTDYTDPSKKPDRQIN